MADLGLGNLISLKRHLLPATLQAGTTYDTVITDLGRAVAGMLETYCNRIFARLAAATHTCPAELKRVILPRYPIESITAVAMRGSGATTFSDVGTATISNYDPTSGLLYIDSPAGSEGDILRVTYTGGYWYDTAETEDTAQPSGSTALPGDLKGAWLLQSRQVWKTIDKLGTGLVSAQSASATLGDSLAGLELIPAVQSTLDRYRRFSV